MRLSFERSVHIQDEESSLIVDTKSRSLYGSFEIQSSAEDVLSSTGTSDLDEDDTINNNMKKRKKRRMEQRQCCKPKKPVINPNANLFQRRLLTSKIEDDQKMGDFVLNSLDPNAKEVKESIAQFHNSLKHVFIRQQHINLSTVRAEYRNEKRKTRKYSTENKSLKDSIIDFYNYSIYVQCIKDMLIAKKTIILFVNLDLWIDLLFCLAYLVEMKQESDIDLSPVWLYKWRPNNLWLACLTFACWDLCSFAIRFFISAHPISVLFSFRCCIEILTTVPFLVSACIPHGRYLYVPYFIRSWVLLLRIKSLMKIKINLQITDKPIDPLKTKLIHLVSTLVVLLYNGTCAFQYTEFTFGTHRYSILESLYVVMVTLSTVGYGDITPNTSESRIVMMLLIIIALAVLPSLISDVSDTLHKRREGEGHVSRQTSPFILIVGSFTPDQVIEILEGFINTEHSEYHLSIVFLDNNRPTEQLKMLERNSIWGHRIQFLHGSVLDEKTLLRVEARKIHIVIIPSVLMHPFHLDQNATEPSKEDERNTVRLWSLYCHTVSHKVPIYTYNLSPSTAIYQKVAKEVICVREFKHYLLAMNCRCRGASTLLTNLLHQRQPMNQYDEGWQAQFDDGSCNEIYTSIAPNCIQGLTFGQAVLFLFEETQVILFAIKTFLPEKKEYIILLNPSHTYEIKPTDECVYIAEGPNEVQDISTLSKPNMDYFTILLSKVIHLKKTGYYEPKERNSPINKPVQQYDFGLSRLPSHQHILLTGSREWIKQIGRKKKARLDQPVCYTLAQPAQLRDMTVQKVELNHHILVCLHRQVINLFQFIYHLRSPHIPPHELQPIVLLCSTQPSEKMFEFIKRFPKVYFVEGNCKNPDDLLRAGVKKAKQVVVMSEKECLDQYERNSDGPAIMTSHILDLILQERQKGSYTIVNLIEKANIKFMHLLQGKDVAEEMDVFYTPAYAAGDVIVDSLISNVLLSQTYYKPDIVSIIKAFCGMPGPFSPVSEISVLKSIPIPPECVGKTFSTLFKALLVSSQGLAIGLLRDTDEELGNELPFVYANPVPSLILKSTDKVYLFSSSFI